VGPVNFMTGPVPNISKTPLVGGQWRIKDGKPVLEIVENTDQPAIAKTGAVRLIGA
jgi:branched-chain amino acid transport system substrate-binding protein